MVREGGEPQWQPGTAIDAGTCQTLIRPAPWRPLRPSPPRAAANGSPDPLAPVHRDRDSLQGQQPHQKGNDSTADDHQPPGCDQGQARGSSTSISSSRGEGDDSGSACVPDAVSEGGAASAAGPTAGRGAAAGVGEAVGAGVGEAVDAGVGVGAGSVEMETRRQPCSCHPGRCTGQVHRCCLPLQMRTIRCATWGRRGPLAGSAWGGAAGRGGWGLADCAPAG